MKGSSPEICYQDVLVLAGPTACGKSEAALLLAQQLNGEIVSVDSMQVYRGLDIGTAKPSASERVRVPHHLIDVADLSESFDAARFSELASEAIAGIRSRGHLPILCGGTGLYFKALFEGLGQAPKGDATLRSQLQAVPLTELLRELAECDPETYEKIDRQNPRRVIRAVEVIRLTGKPFSRQRADWSNRSAGVLPSSGGGIRLGLTRSSQDLRGRIDRRVEEMFGRGLVDETRDLLERGLAQNQTAMQALGYRQVSEYLKGPRSLHDTIDLVKIRTRQYAKRQMTWFRRQLSLKWVRAEADEAVDITVEKLIQACGEPRA